MNDAPYTVTRNTDGSYTAVWRGETRTWHGRMAKTRAYAWGRDRTMRSVVRRDPADVHHIWTHRQIGELFGVSQSRVEFLEVMALYKLREGLLADPYIIGIVQALGLRTQDLAEFEREQE